MRQYMLRFCSQVVVLLHVSFSHPLAILARYPLPARLVQDCELSRTKIRRFHERHHNAVHRHHSCSIPSWLLPWPPLCCPFVYSNLPSQFQHCIPACFVPPQPRNNTSPSFRACPCITNSFPILWCHAEPGARGTSKTSRCQNPGTGHKCALSSFRVSPCFLCVAHIGFVLVEILCRTFVRVVW
ncbi:hypothetical protein B0T20DRAFT_72279 [Sordaria brevicollis]|uniref:Secreted protein n=1 Tax=Sordaria brevicollis TaxID=83679 RepID=A0AAE0P246_SORBR|nr:hypothetical protein B0T20DRAFT_72279 [Sordaria brevicollis]